MRFGSLGWTALAALAAAVPVRGQDDELEQLRKKAAQEKADDVKNLPERVAALEKKLAEIRPESGQGFRVYWKEGLFIESADKNFKFQFGGRMYVDAVLISADNDLENVNPPGPTGAAGKQEDYFDFRAMRLFFAGTMYDRIEYKAEFDFSEGATTAAGGVAGTPAAFKDVYMGVNKIPVIGNIRIGHYKEWFSMEELISSRFIPFMERGLPNVFAPSRNTGASMFNAVLDERLTWAAGLFRDTDNYGRNLGDGEYVGTARLTGLPWYSDEGKYLWHLGVAYTTRKPTTGGTGGTANTLRVRQRPEVHDASRFVDTGNLTNCTDDDRLGLETAAVLGRWSVQGEYMADWINRRAAVNDDLQFDGWYVMGSVFVTGESRTYKKAAGTFDRNRPFNNFMNGEGGAGAVEILARYSNVDLISDGIDGGRMNNYTVGVNWYLNPMTRIMLNYTHSSVEHRGGPELGNADVLGVRFQVDF